MPGPPPDHPRSRGVYNTAFLHTPTLSGSSPLARGLHLTPHALNVKDGIIPARAGFTALTAAAVSACADHPRSRGVYTIDQLINRLTLGSSPLARGLHQATTT